ncbi:MAG: fibronectin type III domain-containing protein [Patulibacter minatonensis]
MSRTAIARRLAAGAGLLATALSIAPSALAADTTPPTEPGPLAVTANADGSVTATWAPSTDDVGVDHYEWNMWAGGPTPPRQSTAATTITVPGLTPSGYGVLSVWAVDAAGNRSLPAQWGRDPMVTARTYPTPKVPETPVVATPTPPASTPTPAASPLSGPASGITLLRTASRGGVGLTGTVAGRIEQDGAVSADVQLATATARLTAYGVFPVVAQLAYERLAVQGTATSSSFRGTATFGLRVRKATVLGLSIASGADCRATGTITAPLTGPGLATRALTMNGTYAIPSFANCGAGTGALTALLSGSGNVLTLSLGA